MALLLLAHAAYRDRLRAATIDHGLRPEATNEAAMVRRHCEAAGIDHAILADSARSLRGANIQSRARSLRYRLLGQWAAERGIAIVLTAHHLDDQAETFLMRAARGSGVTGLAGIRPVQPFGGDPALMVIRPLLGWRKSELVAIVEAAGIAVADDPSNRDARHDRTVFRRLLAANRALDSAALARSARLVGEAGDLIEQLADAHLEEHFRIEDEVAHLRHPADCHPAIRRRMFEKLLVRLNANARPRGDAITRLLDGLAAGRVMTLAGIRCVGGTDWCFSPAPPRNRA